MNEHHLARNLAVFSLGLGLAELLAPRQVARLIGISEDHERTLQLFGLREIASGIGIMQGNPAHFLWSRVAGDIMDLSMLGAAMKSEESDSRRVKGAMIAVAAVTALDIVASLLHSRDHSDPSWRDPRSMESRAGISRERSNGVNEHQDAVIEHSQPSLVT